MSGHIDPSKEQFAIFKYLPREGPIHMLNLIRLRAQAAYADGRQASGHEAYRAYGRAVMPIIQRLGAQQFWVGQFEQTLIGPADERWDVVFIMQYPSADALVAMLRDPEYRQAVLHRQAAVEDSRLIRLRPGQAGGELGE